MIKSFHFKNNLGNKLAADLYIPDKYENAIIIMHGFAGNKDAKNKISWANALMNSGFLVMTFDFAGHGNSEGDISKTTITQNVNDLEAAIEFLRKNYQFDKLGLFGHSTGAATAMIEASENPSINAIALLSCTFTRDTYAPYAMPKEEIENWGKKGFLHYYEDENTQFNLSYDFHTDAQKYNNPELVKKIKCPVLIIHSDSDPYIPVEIAREFFNYITSEKEMHVIKGASHGLTENLDEVNRILVEFFNDKF
ncbi:alpha/beta hydrolase [Candidatus Woesearchaeota archaeon]|nr:alpha/beta hydrolase [Candidatus Woesearchaeota archaeon]